MLKPIEYKINGIITITGATKSGKSQLAELLIKKQDSITYIATSKPRENDKEWQRRIELHKLRRPNNWNLLEYPSDICKAIESIEPKESILLDSLGGIVEKYLSMSNVEWKNLENNFINCLNKSESGIIVVCEEIGWGIVPSTQIGHLFRERHTYLCSLLSCHSSKKWLAINGIAIELDKIGYQIP